MKTQNKSFVTRILAAIMLPLLIATFRLTSTNQASSQTGRIQNVVLMHGAH
jgi:hypothetical protein